MNFLIIGLGSMGKRRIRNLQFLHVGKIIGADLREDRRKEVEKLYGIETRDDIRKVSLDSIDSIIVSTPPDKHEFAMQFAIENHKPVFVEASVVLDGLDKLNTLAEKNKVLVCPSCTLRFHPAIQSIKQLAQSGKYGKITNFSYHIGQYLPDWHPWEKLTDSYTSNKETGGAREMVAFDLTWLTDIVGYPKRICGFFGKTIDLGINIDDTYAMILDCEKSFGTFIADVTSRYATRRLLLNMERGQILWSWNEKFISIYDARTHIWKKKFTRQGKAHEKYNKNITEEMYIEEMKAYINAIKNKHPFSNTLSDDINVLKLLYKVESENT